MTSVMAMTREMSIPRMVIGERSQALALVSRPASPAGGIRSRVARCRIGERSVGRRRTRSPGGVPFLALALGAPPHVLASSLAWPTIRRLGPRRKPAPKEAGRLGLLRIPSSRWQCNRLCSSSRMPARTCGQRTPSWPHGSTAPAPATSPERAPALSGLQMGICSVLAGDRPSRPVLRHAPGALRSRLLCRRRICRAAARSIRDSDARSGCPLNHGDVSRQGPP